MMRNTTRKSYRAPLGRLLPCSAFSVVEMIVAIGVVGVGVVAVMGAVTVLSSGSAYTADTVAASALAQSLMAEIDIRPYQASTPSPTGRVSDGLVLYYPLEDAAGTIVSDESRAWPLVPLEIPNAELVKWIPGSNGVSIEAGGRLASSTAAGKLSSACVSSGRVSVELWIEPAGLACAESAIMSFAADAVLANCILAQRNANLLFYVRTSAADAVSSTPTATLLSPLKSEIMHIVAVYNGSIATIYVNGSPAAQTVPAGSLALWQSYPVQIGQLQNFGASWQGKIFLAAIYSQALTQEQVNINYQVGPSPGHLHNRTGYDDIDDYNGYADSPPCAEDGSPIAGAAAFSRTVDVRNVLPGNLDSVQSWNSTDAKRIRVQVFRNYRLLATCVRGRYRGVSSDDTPPADY